MSIGVAAEVLEWCTHCQIRDYVDGEELCFLSQIHDFEFFLSRYVLVLDQIYEIDNVGVDLRFCIDVFFSCVLYSLSKKGLV